MFNQPNQNKMKNLNANLVEVVTNSTDYKVIENLVGFNRKVNKLHVNKLKQSIIETGSAGVMIKTIRTKAFKNAVQIINADGQHRLEACKQLGVPFNYMVLEMEEDNELNVTQYIALHNEVVVRWGGDVYLNSYALNGLAEYKTFKKLKEKHNLTNTDMFKIFGVNQKEFTGGVMKFEDEANSLLLLKAIVKVKPHVPNKAFVRRSLFKVMNNPKEYSSFATAIVNASKVLNKIGVGFSENEAEFLTQLIDIKSNMNMKKAA
jgi:hypothetical protein